MGFGAETGSSSAAGAGNLTAGVVILAHGFAGRRRLAWSGRKRCFFSCGHAAFCWKLPHSRSALLRKLADFPAAFNGNTPELSRFWPFQIGQIVRVALLSHYVALAVVKAG